ncbi:MAG: dTDP-4-dehydrorhamnose reductase [bacterium]
MKILIIGSRGMLGQYLLKTFLDNLPLPAAPREKQRGWEVIGWDRDEIDITDQKQVNEKIKNLKPNLIINSAAYNNVDDCEKNPDLANLINGYAPGYLALMAKKLDIPIIHYSTGYVFDGEKGDYKEDDLPNPISKYAESKLLGEHEVKKNNDKFYIIRTNLLFGNPSIGGKKSFIELMLNLAKEKDKLEVVNDEISNPTYAKDLADATYELVNRYKRHVMEGDIPKCRLQTDKNFPDNKKYPYGIYHFVNDGSASWYDWAKEIFKIKNIDIKVEPVPSSKFPRPAKRPKNSSLLNTKFSKLRTWQESLREYLY